MIYINFDMPEDAKRLLPYTVINDNEVRASPTENGAADREGLNAFPVLGEQ